MASEGAVWNQWTSWTTYWAGMLDWNTGMA